MLTVPPESAAAIQMRGVSLSYPKRRNLLRRDPERFWALRDVTMNIPEGKVLGVVGENGAGKSSLLSLLAGILKPDGGSLVQRRGLRTTLLSLQAGFNEHLSGRDNLLISGLLLGMTKAEIQEKSGAMVELADIGSFIDQPLRTYSTGMKARLGFAVAYYTDADVMLLDEVFAVGDLEFSRKARALMEEKVREDRTVVMVSHGEHILKQLCENLVWLQDGRVKALGPTDQVWERYEETYLKQHR